MIVIETKRIYDRADWYHSLAIVNEKRFFAFANTPEKAQQAVHAQLLADGITYLV